MTIVAYKDGVLAADKQCCDAGMARTVTKIRRLKDGRLAGASGNSSMCRRMLDWIDDGADISKHPDTKDQCNVLVVNLDGSLDLYDEGAAAIKLEDPFAAIGCGRDYALGAMACGASAVKAVDIACRFDIHCGQGVDMLRLRQNAATDTA